MKRVLVVEDEPDSLEMMEYLLESEGYDVMGATNGQLALRVLADVQPDLIITDVMMPYMGGDELLAEIRRDTQLRSIPVLVMSAGEGADVARRFGSSYLKKPLDIDVLIRTVRTLIDH